MNILIDIRLLGPGGNSGIEEYTRQLLTHLFALDAKNHYTLFYNGVIKTPLPPLVKNHPNVSIMDWRVPNRLLDLSMRIIHRPQIDRGRNFDLMFSPHFTQASTAHTPRIITFHDLSFLHHHDFFRARQKFWHWLQNFRETARDADHIIADSEFTKYDLVHTLHVPEEKITVIAPGVNPALHPLPASNAGLKEFRTRHNLNFPFLLSVGTLEPRKNIQGLIRAFNLLKRDTQFSDLRLIIAGREGWLYENILTEAKRSPHQDHIIFWGKMSEDDKLYLYNQAVVFLYPSFFEGFGFPPLEAQACGTPVILGDRTSLPEIVGDSAIRVNPWNIDEIAFELKRVLGDQTLRTTLIENGKENAKRFNWETTAKKTLTLFKHYESR